MKPTEAFAILGVEAGVDQKNLRRAYLRLLKTRKPDVDPAGFQQLREAYELAQALTPDAPEGDAPPQLTASPPSPGGAESGEGHGGAEKEEQKGEEPPPAPETDRPPGPAADRQRDTEEPEAAKDLAKAEEPEAAEDTEDAEDAEDAPAQESEGSAREVRVSCKELARAFEAAARGSGEAPPAWLGISAVLALLAEEEGGKAAVMRKALEAYFGAVGETKVLSSGQSLLWNLTRELSLLGKRISPDMRAAIASALRQGSPEAAAPLLTDWATDEPDEASTLLVTLRKRAPLLAQLYGTSLQPAPRVRAQKKSGPNWNWYWSPWVILMVIRGLSSLAGSGSVSSSAPLTTPSQMEKANTPMAQTPLREQTIAGIRELMKEADRSGDSVLSKAAGELLTAIHREDCSTIRKKVGNAAVNEATRAKNIATFRQLVEDAKTLCRGSEGGDSP